MDGAKTWHYSLKPGLPSICPSIHQSILYHSLSYTQGHRGLKPIPVIFLHHHHHRHSSRANSEIQTIIHSHTHTHTLSPLTVQEPGMQSYLNFQTPKMTGVCQCLTSFWFLQKEEWSMLSTYDDHGGKPNSNSFKPRRMTGALKKIRLCIWRTCTRKVHKCAWLKPMQSNNFTIMPLGLE